MSYHIKQDYQYVGHDFWTWRAWIESDERSLDGIVAVEGILHPTFSTLRIVSSDRASRFLLETAGWGTFELCAVLRLTNSEVKSITYQLVLEYPVAEAGKDRDAGKPRSTTKRPQVYLSYGSEDTAHAQAVKTALKDYPINIVDASSIKLRAPLRPTVRQLIRRSDAVIGLAGTETASPLLI